MIFARAVVLLCSAAILSGCADRPPRPSQFVAPNSLTVVPNADDSFEVIAQPGSAGPDFFCAAGQYARVMLNASAADRVVVSRPTGPSFYNPGGRAASFEVRPAGSVAPRRGILVSAARVGNNLSVAHAQKLCRTRPFGFPNTL